MNMQDKIPCYIINLVTGSRIEVDILPDEISESKDSQFDSVDLRGRSAPLQGYNCSGARSVSYSLTLHDDYCKGGLLSTVRKLKALEYPEYANSSLTPPKCYVRFGSMISMSAIVTSVSITWKKPYRNGFYINADVNLEFSEVVDTPYSASQIEAGGDFIG